MTPDYLAHLQRTLADIEGAGLFKRERVITTPQRAHITVAGGRQVLNFCANNYQVIARNKDGQSCFVVSFTACYTNFAQMRSAEIPQAWRTRMEAYHAAWPALPIEEVR